MRRTLAKWLSEYADSHPGTRLLTNDLGFSVLDEFRHRHPHKFINCGIAEPNMVGVAAGLALTGHTPFVYSIASFLILRALEQIKLDVCASKLNVKLIGVGAGVDYNHAGLSHFSIDDIGLTMALPGMQVLSPADKFETQECLEWMVATPGPCYLRLSNAAVEDKADRPRMQANRIIPIHHGSGIAVITSGTRLKFYLEHLPFFRERNITLLHAPILSPFDEAGLLRELSSVREIITVEDQYQGLGLSSLVADAIAERGLNVRLERKGFSHSLVSRYGTVPYLRKAFQSDDGEVLKRLEDLTAIRLRAAA